MVYMLVLFAGMVFFIAPYLYLHVIKKHAIKVDNKEQETYINALKHTFFASIIAAIPSTVGIDFYGVLTLVFYYLGLLFTIKPYLKTKTQKIAIVKLVIMI